VRFYDKRGTAEQWITEGKQAVEMTWLSCHRHGSNEARLWLRVMAYNLGNLWRRFVVPRRIENRPLTSLQQRLVNTGGRLVQHAGTIGCCRRRAHRQSPLRISDLQLHNCGKEEARRGYT
jgi:hypothetical protein